MIPNCLMLKYHDPDCINYRGELLDYEFFSHGPSIMMNLSHGKVELCDRRIELKHLGSKWKVFLD